MALSDAITQTLIDQVTAQPALGRALDRLEVVPSRPGKVRSLLGRSPTGLGRALLDLVGRSTSPARLPRENFIDMVVGPQITREDLEQDRERTDTQKVVKVSDACDALTVSMPTIVWALIDPAETNILNVQCEQIRKVALGQTKPRLFVTRSRFERIG
jgi:hypothetical protein